MDRNVAQPPAGAQGTDPLSSMQSTQSGGAGQTFTEQPNVMQPTVSPQSPPSMQPPIQEESSRITLKDLYGPSQPHELQQHAVPEPESTQPQQPFQVNEPQQVTAPEMQRRSAEMPVQQPPSQTQQVGVQSVSEEARMPAQKNNQGEKIDSEGPHFSGILRIFVFGVVILIIILLIAGLGSLIFSGNKGSSAVNLTYWGLWEDANVMQPVLDGFHKEYPNVTVTYIKQDPKDYTKRLLTRMQEGDGPDIFRLHNSWIYPLQSVLLPLPTAVISAKDLSTNYPPVVSQDMINNGAIYGLPLSMDSLTLFVNTDIFTHAGASVPTTWDNFITVAKALTVKDPDGHIQTSGASIGAFDNVAHASDILSLLFLQNGANLQKLQNSSNASDTLTFYTSFAKGDTSVWDPTLDNSLLAFERGKVAMYFGYSFDIFAIQTANPSLKFATYPVPHLPGRDMTIASYWVEGVSNRSKHQKESLEFIQYLARKDIQTEIYTQEAKSRSFGELYARTDLAQDLTANPLLAPFVNQFKTAQSSFFVDGTDYDEYNGALDQYLGNAVNSILKDTSADSAAATLAQGVAQVLGTYAPKTQQ